MQASSEASISKTLEAILSKTDDDDEALLSAKDISASGVGGQTLLGLGSVFPGPGHLASADHVDHEAAGPSISISVDAMFDEDDQPKATALPPPAEDNRVGDLLDEVAEALNVQAAESRERAIGRVPEPLGQSRSKAGANTPVVKATADEFEFEDPDDGPTTLNSGDDGVNVVVAADGQEDDQEDDREEEESVVLGPATRKGDSHPTSLPGVSARATLPAPPMPGTGGAGGSRPHRATPFAGLPAATLPTFPAPASGRARLPTPAPGHALGLPSPSGRTVLPTGAPMGTAGESAPMPVGMPDSSRRTLRVSAPIATLAAAGADVSGHHGNHHGLVSEPFSAAMTTASTMLKKDVRFRIASFGAIVLVTFVGGLLIGPAIFKGKGKSEADTQPATARGADPAVQGGPAAAGTSKAAANGEAPKIEPVAARPTVAEAAPPGAAQMQFDPQPIRKRRARRASVAPKDDVALSAPAPKGPVRIAAAGPVGKAPTAGKSSPKKKSAWHDPFAD